jgi:hypothetical protein
MEKRRRAGLFGVRDYRRVTPWGLVVADEEHSTSRPDQSRFANTQENF